MSLKALWKGNEVAYCLRLVQNKGDGTKVPCDAVLTYLDVQIHDAQKDRLVAESATKELLDLRRMWVSKRKAGTR